MMKSFPTTLSFGFRQWSEWESFLPFLYFLSAYTVVDRYLNHTTALPLHMHLYDNENDDVQSIDYLKLPNKFT